MDKSFAFASVCILGLIAAPAYAQNASSAPSPRFISQQSPDQWQVSKLSGVAVYGADNQKIGSIDDILINSKGEARVAVIGIGGFLGVGQKDVGVPFSSLQWSKQTEGRTAASPDSGAASAPNSTYPASAMLNATKDQLENAPTFQYAANANPSGNTNGVSNTSANHTNQNTGTNAPH